MTRGILLRNSKGELRELSLTSDDEIVVSKELIEFREEFNDFIKRSAARDAMIKALTEDDDG